MQHQDLALILPDMLARLWSFAFGLARNERDAEALVRRACQRGLASAHSLRAGTSPLHWMFSIVHSLGLHQTSSAAQPRNWRMKLQMKLQMKLRAKWYSVRRSMMRMTQQQIVIDVIERLPPAQRVALLLIGAERLGYEEAADVLGIDTAAFIERLTLARKRVGEALEPQANVCTVFERRTLFGIHAE